MANTDFVCVIVIVIVQSVGFLFSFFLVSVPICYFSVFHRCLKCVTLNIYILCSGFFEK